MTERRFPTDAEVDAWIAEHMVARDDPRLNTPEGDQLNAALSESSGRTRGAAPGLVASGQVQWFFADEAPDDSKFRGAVRQYLAAASAGIRPLCRHTRLIRPLMMFCDPPVVVCFECLREDSDGFRAKMAALGWNWDFQCDRCGARSEKLTPVQVGGLGNVTISGHVCRACVADDERTVAKRINPFMKEN